MQTVLLKPVLISYCECAAYQTSFKNTDCFKRLKVVLPIHIHAEEHCFFHFEPDRTQHFFKKKINKYSSQNI